MSFLLWGSRVWLIYTNPSQTSRGFGFCWIFQENLKIFQPCILLLPEKQTLQIQCLFLMGRKAKAPAYPAWKSRADSSDGVLGAWSHSNFIWLGILRVGKKIGKAWLHVCPDAETAWLNPPMISEMLLVPVISQPRGQTGTAGLWARADPVCVCMGGVCVWCVYVSQARGHHTKLPLNLAAVGCRTDIIFNEIITYSERRCTFNAGDLGKRSTNRCDLARWPLRCLPLCIMHKVRQLWY